MKWEVVELRQTQQIKVNLILIFIEWIFIALLTVL